MADLNTEIEKVKQLQREYEISVATADPAFGPDIELEMRYDKVLRRIAPELLRIAQAALFFEPMARANEILFEDNSLQNSLTMLWTILEAGEA